MKNLSILFLLILLATPTYAWQSNSVKKAHDFISAGMTTDAIHTLKTGIQTKPRDHAAHWLLGQLYLEQGSFSSADERFNSAVKLHPSYGPQTGTLYKDAGDQALSKGNLNRAATLYDQAIHYDPALKDPIAKARSDYKTDLYRQAQHHLSLGNIKAAKPIYDRILEMAPSDRASMIQSILRVGEQQSDGACVKIAQLAASLCENRCPPNEKTGTRLEKIARALDRKDIHDAQIRPLMELASQFKPDVKPIIKVYQPGEEVIFELAKGEWNDHWMVNANGYIMILEYIFENTNFEIHYKNGVVVRAWKGERPPDKIDSPCRIKAVGDNEIKVKFIEKK